MLFAVTGGLRIGVLMQNFSPEVWGQRLPENIMAAFNETLGL